MGGPPVIVVRTKALSGAFVYYQTKRAKRNKLSFLNEYR